MYLCRGELLLARRSYDDAKALAVKIRETMEPNEMVEEKAGVIERMAGNRSRSVVDPEGAVLAVIDAVGRGDLEEFKLFADTEDASRMGVGEQAWSQLSTRERSRMVACCEAVCEQWMLDTSDYYRALQCRVDHTARNGDSAQVTMLFTSTFAEAEIVFLCVNTDRGWKVRDFTIPTLGTGLVLYVRETMALTRRNAGNLKNVLKRRDAEEICKLAFEEVEARMLDLEDSFIGKRVKLNDDPSSLFDVVNQEIREDEWWIQVCIADDLAANVKWVLKDRAEVVETEQEIWAVD